MDTASTARKTGAPTGNTVALTGLLLAEDDAFTVLDDGLIDGLGLGPPDEP